MVFNPVKNVKDKTIIMIKNQRKKQAEDLKTRIYEIQKSNKDSKDDPNKEVIFVNGIPTNLFIEMAYCFIAKHGE